MPSYHRRHEAEVEASPRACFEVLTDYERIPEWQGPVKRCEVLACDPQGRGSLVEFEIDAKLRSITYRLRYVYDEPRSVTNEYCGGDLRELEGGWTFEDRGNGRTHVLFDLRIDPGRFVPRGVADMLNERVMGQSLRDFCRRVEELSAAPSG